MWNPFSDDSDKLSVEDVDQEMFGDQQHELKEFDRVSFNMMQDDTGRPLPFMCHPRNLFKKIGMFPDAKRLAIMAAALQLQIDGNAPGTKGGAMFAKLVLEDVMRAPSSLEMTPQDALKLLAIDIDDTLFVRIVVTELAAGLYMVNYPDGTRDTATGKDDCIPKVQAFSDKCKEMYHKNINIVVTSITSKSNNQKEE